MNAITQQKRRAAIQISLRSLLSLTFGAAVTAIACSFLMRTSLALKPQSLLYALLIFYISMTFTVANSFRLRKKAIRKSGELFIAIPVQSRLSISWARWLWLLCAVPILFIMLSYLLNSVSGTYFRLACYVYALCLVMPLSKLGLQVWAEESTNSIELCENGIAFFDQYYDWSSPKTKNIQVLRYSGRLTMSMGNLRKVVPVTKEQKERVREILEKHYPRLREPNPFDEATDQT